MKKLLFTLLIGVGLANMAFAEPCKVGDRVVVQIGYLVFEDRHKQEEMAATHAGKAEIKAAIEDGDCVMLKHPVEATVVDEVGQEIQIEQDAGMRWWTTKSAVRVAR
jgi:hypothetical protein